MKTPPLRYLLLVVAFAWMSTLTSQAGWIKRYVYNNINGVLVTNLFGTNQFGTVVFPASPDSVELLPATSGSGPFEAEFPNSFFDNWGTWTPGYIEPPETGNYIFWVYGDDETQLWITTDGTDPLNPAKKQLIASVPVWAAIREWGKFPEQQSAPVSLEKGKRYYMEVLHKDGTGGDAWGLGWQLPSGKLERPFQTFYLQPTFDSNDPTVVNGPFAVPVTPISPGDGNIYDGQEAILFADLNLTPPYTVQWLRGAADIVGETQTYYRFRARNSDNGAQFSVRVNGTVYGPLTLAVQSDATQPSLVSATVAAGNPTQIEVVFSEEVTATSANSLSSYSLSSGAVQSAQLQADGRTVILKTGLLAAGVLHSLTINNIQDMALPANTIPNTQTNIIIADGAITFRSWGLSRPDSLDTLRHWSHAGSTALSYVNNLFIEERVITTTSYQWSLTPARENFTSQMIGYLTPPESGNYKFAIASDDHSILYLGTTDQRSSKREICNYNGSTGRWNTGQQLANQQSGLVYLEAGKTYYIEAVSRDGTGGDGISVFWQTPSGPPLPTINQNVQSVTEPFLIPPQYLSTFASPPVPGGISFRIWDTLPTDLATLRTWSNTNSVAPSYTNNLFVQERTITTNSFQWPLVPLDNHYMGQIIGYLTAPETGNYQFAITSDDHSVLYLGTSDQRSSKREICNNNAFTTSRWNLGANAAQRSANISLQAGQRYYFEAVWRDGTGGDGVTIAWFTPSMAAASAPWPPSPGDNQAATQPYIIPATYMSTFNTFGNVFLATDLPASISAAESTRPTLSVKADGTRSYAYQWYKGGVPIAGATASSYTLPYVSAGDNNATFQVIVTNSFSSVTSALATLTVTTDTTKPTVTSVGSLFKQTVEVQLSEPATTATATAAANYLLLTSAGTPVAVNTATVDANDPAHITLQTGAMPETDAMTLVVQNLADLSAAANVMSPSTNAFRANNFDALTRINNSQAFSARAVGNQILMTAGGSDIWGTADQCAFLSKTVTGNFDFKVQGVSLQTVDQWCKMGLMARPSTAAGDRNVFNAFTALVPSQNTYTPQVRDVAGGASTSSDAAGAPLNLGLQGGVVARPTVAYPSWLRLQRIGNVFYWYYGTTGTNWTFWTYYDSAANGEALPATLEVGVALTSHNTTLTTDGIMASFTAVSDGALNVALQPTNTTVVEGGTAVFTTAAGGSAPYFYQWRKNNTDIPEATNAVLSLPRVSFCTDNNAQISCRISNPYGQAVTSANATLTVLQDTVPPTVAYHLTPKINITATEVRLRFSEWVDATTSQDTANYQIFTSPGNTPLTVSAALLDVDERTVILTTDAHTPGTTYRVVVSNVKDLACNPNTIAASSTDYYFFSGTAANYRQRADGYIIMEAENAQENIIAGDGDEFGFTNSLAGYSGTGAMRVPNGAGTGGTAGTGTQQYGTGAKLVFHINFTQTGRNIIWIRGWNETTAGNDDSIFVGYNNDVGVGDSANDWLVGMNTDVNQSQLTGYPNTAWQWRSDRSAGTDPMTFTNTTTGLHRFIIWQREDGTHIDKIVLEPGNRAAGNTAAPAPATANGDRGEAETWDYIVSPPAAPTVSISSHVNGQSFPAGNVQITATVTGPSPIARVEFFQGANLIGTATSAPYTITWLNVPEGIYSLTARVTDVLGNQATSAAVKIVEAGALTLTDVTTPGDPIFLTAGSSPAAETVTNMINNTTSKCLNYDAFDTGLPFVGPVGFVVTPSQGASIVSKLRFYTANDFDVRDPAHYVLEGSNDGNTWSLISSNLLNLPPGRNAGGLALDPLTQNVWHVAFANTNAYTSYRLQFFDAKDNSAANSVQLAEVELLGNLVAPLTLGISTGAGGALTLTASQPGTLLSTTNLTAPVIWVEEGPVSGSVVIPPAPDVPAKYYRLRVP